MILPFKYGKVKTCLMLTQSAGLLIMVLSNKWAEYIDVKSSFSRIQLLRRVVVARSWELF